MKILPLSKDNNEIWPFKYPKLSKCVLDAPPHHQPLNFSIVQKREQITVTVTKSDIKISQLQWKVRFLHFSIISLVDRRQSDADNVSLDNLFLASVLGFFSIICARACGGGLEVYAAVGPAPRRVA